MDDKQLEQIEREANEDKQCGLGQSTRADERLALVAEVRRVRRVREDGDKASTPSGTENEYRDAIWMLYNYCEPYSNDPDDIGANAEHKASRMIDKWQAAGWRPSEGLVASHRS